MQTVIKYTPCLRFTIARKLHPFCWCMYLSIDLCFAYFKKHFFSIVDILSFHFLVYLLLIVSCVPAMNDIVARLKDEFQGSFPVTEVFGTEPYADQVRVLVLT